MPLRMFVSADVEPAIRETLRAEWSEIGLLEEAGEIRQLAAEPPAFIQIIGDAMTWSAMLTGAFFTGLAVQLGKETATDLYKNREKIGRALASAGAATLEGRGSRAQAGTRGYQDASRPSCSNRQ